MPTLTSLTPELPRLIFVVVASDPCDISIFQALRAYRETCEHAVDAYFGRVANDWTVRK